MYRGVLKRLSLRILRHGLRKMNQKQKQKKNNRKTRIRNYRVQLHMTQRSYRNEAPDRLTVSISLAGSRSTVNKGCLCYCIKTSHVERYLLKMQKTMVFQLNRIFA